MPRSPLIWRCRDRQIVVGPRTLLMGVVNVTPDSFYDGGRSMDAESALSRALRLIDEGADFIDVGGESTRPGAEPVDADEELRRVLPVIRGMADQSTVLISIDTMKATVARVALEAGAHIVNDVSSLRHDPDMAGVVRESGAGVILMHMQGTPRTMQDRPTYEKVTAEVIDFLTQRLIWAQEQGIESDRVAMDPGIGFGKTSEHNWTLLRHLSTLRSLGRPLVVGVSRKRFLGDLTERVADDRLPASLGALALAVANGAQIMRVHDIKESCDTARVADKMNAEKNDYDTTRID